MIRDRHVAPGMDVSGAPTLSVAPSKTLRSSAGHSCHQLARRPVTSKESIS